MNQFQRHNQLIDKEKFASYAPLSLQGGGGGGYNKFNTLKWIWDHM